MSNAVDILLVDGPAFGHMVCVPRPVPAQFTADVNGDDFMYETAKFYHPTKGWVWIAHHTPDYPVESVAGLIDAAHMERSWDLNLH